MDTDYPSSTMQLTESMTNSMRKDAPSISTSRDSTGSNSSLGSAVSFGTIQVREYERVLGQGDAFMCLELGWEYEESQQLCLDEYEKGGKGVAVPYSPPQRFQILNFYGYSYDEVSEHEKLKFAQKAMERQNNRGRQFISSRLGKRVLRLLRIR